MTSKQMNKAWKDGPGREKDPPKHRGLREGELTRNGKTRRVVGLDGKGPLGTGQRRG